MRRSATAFASTTAAALLVACGGTGAPPAPPSLAYEVPAEPTATYVKADTAVVSVDAGGQMIDVTASSRTTMDMSFAPEADGGVRVTTTFSDLEATASNPMGPSEEVREDAVEGELVFTLSRTGEGALVSAPDVDERAQTFLSPTTIAATFFPRLPGRAVTPGETWTDTVTVDTEEGNSTIQSTSVVTYTAAGDTTVMGSRYLMVRMTTRDDRMFEGTEMGMSMSQDLTGTSEGWFLWDPVRKLPAEIVIRSEAEGSMEVSAAPFPLGIATDNTTRVTLQPLAGGGM